MAQALVNLFRLDDPDIAESMLASLREQGLDGSVVPEQEGGAVLLFWRRDPRPRLAEER
jgi:hypothetical protein